MGGVFLPQRSLPRRNIGGKPLSFRSGRQSTPPNETYTLWRGIHSPSVGSNCEPRLRGGVERERGRVLALALFLRRPLLSLSLSPSLSRTDLSLARSPLQQARVLFSPRALST